MSDAEEIKRRMLEQMQNQMATEQQQKAEQDSAQAQRQALLRQLLESEARGRLERIKLAKPEEGTYIENQIIMLFQMGRIKQRISDSMLKKLIPQLLPKKRDIKIRRI